MTTFDLLHEKIKRVIWDLGWEGFRPIQDEAINHLIITPSDTIISAPTAGGKTEAAFLPIISKIIDNANDSVKILYISPLKALINDQFNRITDLCKKIDFPITKWHGDASAYKKQQLIKSPAGILLITPESIEALFVNRSSHLEVLFNNLEYIVIDEIHSFIENERGTHLRSLIRRIEAKLKNKPITIALSATINNSEDIKAWINPVSPQSVKLIKEETSGSNPIQGIIRGFLGDKENKELELKLFDVIKNDKNLVFANNKNSLELYCDKMQQIAKEKTFPNRFYIHHGSLSKNIRETVESNLKKEKDISVFCTNTLELGIDIGNIKRTILLQPPFSVSSMIQRLGRSGRKENEAKEFQFFINEKPIEGNTNWPSRFRINLVQSIAIVELMLEKWCEPLATNKFDHSTFIHQLLSFLTETGGASSEKLYQEIGINAFNKHFTVQEFIEILKALKENEIIYQSNSNLIALDKKGEKITENYEFYAAFQASKEWKVVFNSKEIGHIDATNLLFIVKGSHILLAGQRWQVIDIKNQSEVILVKRATELKPIIFCSEGGNIHSKIYQKMKEIYDNKKIPTYLDISAKKLLEEAFEQYEIYITGKDSCILPVFAGTKTQKTVALLLGNLDIEFESTGIGFYISEGKDIAIERLRDIDFDSLDLTKLLKKTDKKYKLLKKYDYLLSETLLNKSYASLALDFDEAKLFCKAK